MPSPRVSAARLASLLPAPAVGPPGEGPAYQSLADGIRLLVADGRLLHGTRLPSERELTAALPVSRTTVARAYAELRERGYLTSRRGSGSLATVPGGPQPGTANVLHPTEESAGLLDLSYAAPTAGVGALAAYEAAIEQLPRHLCGTGYHPAGLPLLREALAARFTGRGLPTDPDQVIVTSGAVAATAVAAQALLGTGDRVLVESPGYPNALATLRRKGARLVGVPVGQDGLDLDALGELAGHGRGPRAAAAVLVPDFQNPTGSLMSEADRQVVAHALRRAGAVPVVDETMVDVGLDVTEMPRPFGTFAHEAVTVGSASKSYWGGLRVGWMRVPRPQVGRFLEARVSLDLGSPVLEQLVVTELLRMGEPLLEARRGELRRRRAVLRQALAEQLPEWEAPRPPGGLTLWCRLPEPRSTALAVAAERHGALIAPGSSFAVDGKGLERFLRVPYTLDEEALRDAVGALGRAWEHAQGPGASRTRRGRRPMVA
ncbi:MAG TPA: PLP-dependent aminotransferase family protein [Segeticoccus sp.]|nr:PLP-dependent aminotransferase family protein [Segeticoccus sp.]